MSSKKASPPSSTTSQIASSHAQPNARSDDGTPLVHPYSTLKVTLPIPGVLVVALNRPEVRNAFNDEVVTELHHVFTDLVTQDRVRAVVLKGEGTVFSAGGDLNWMKKAIDYDYETNLRDTRALAALFAKMNECAKPLIGAVHGAAIGGGVGLVSVCDLVVATQETQFSLSEVRLGLIPACIGPFVLSKVGASHARSLFISAERFGAEKAKSIGLIHDVVADSKALQDAVERVVGNILQCGPNAVTAAKQLVHTLSWPESRERHPDCLEYVAKTLADLRVSAEGQEGVRAFLEKRKPSWLLGE